MMNLRLNKRLKCFNEEVAEILVRKKNKEWSSQAGEAVLRGQENLVLKQMEAVKLNAQFLSVLQKGFSHDMSPL